MLHKTVYLVGLQVFCPSDDAELNKIAGKIRNLYYAASLPWANGNLGRVIPKSEFNVFHQEYKDLHNAFFKLCSNEEKERFQVNLMVVPFPTGNFRDLERAPAFVSTAVESRLVTRLTMLQDALLEEKKFYGSILEGLGKIIETGLYLHKSIEPQLISRLKRAKKDLLRYSAEDIRQLTSVREEIITICGELL